MPLFHPQILTTNREYFHHDVPDPHLFDLVVNVEKLGPERTSHLIADAVASYFDVHRSP